MNLTSPQHGKRLLGALALSATLALGFSACGSGSSSGGAPGIGGGGGQEQAVSDYDLKYAECMREQGIQMADPDPNSDAMAAVGEKGELEQAEKVCEEKLGEGSGQDADSQQANDQKMVENGRKTAACYREHGFDVADPTSADEPVQLPSDVPDSVAKDCAHGGNFSAGNP